MQAAAIMSDAARDVAEAVMAGRRPVDLNLAMVRFHAMTPKARVTEAQLGVHDIGFDISVTDAATGAVLAEEQGVNADFRAFSGTKAILAEQAGETQKVRIRRHVAEVVKAWLSNLPVAGRLSPR